jgi:O-acetyl-ADP-ribose deacetylase (regulator of RNase III)
MITFKTGDIFTSDAEYLVNPTNFQGPMAGGLARAFAVRFHGIEREYCRICKSPKFAPKIQSHDYMAIWRGLNNQRVVCFPTMDLGSQADLGRVKIGLAKLATYMAKQAPASIAIPKIGCGIGGLDWQDVRAEIVKAFDNIDGLTVEVWE